MPLPFPNYLIPKPQSLNYPFKPVVEIPSVNCRCVKKYKIRIGIVVITDPAITFCVNAAASRMKLDNPTVIGRHCAVLVTINGH